MSAQLRQVAKQERENRSILRVGDLEIGIRLVFPYLLVRLQMYLHEHQTGRFANDVMFAGQLSRAPHQGCGYIEMHLDRIEVPHRDWTAFDEGGNPPFETHVVYLSREATTDLTELCRKAHKMAACHLFRELSVCLQAAYSMNTPSFELREMLAEEASSSPATRGTSAVLHIEEWTSALLQSTASLNIDRRQL